MANIPINKQLYEKAKKKVYAQYATHSAYRSQAVQKEYIKMGGKYKTTTDNKKKVDKKPLARWRDSEKWVNLNAKLIGLNLSCGKKYPNQKDPTVCRPSIKGSEKTPTPLASELTPQQIRNAIQLKKLKKTINWKKL